ncbi:MAG: glycosyltransferase involved in cell wall biosis-like protein [Solirubrobacterales bacterium]|nr:glycosyltransferase involved in cell wall biosis-like protein [Solirubrobacterales bacterium]
MLYETEEARAHRLPSVTPPIVAVVRTHWPLLATVSGAVLWTAELIRVRPEDVGDAGLITALPAVAFVALALVCVGLGAALGRPQTSARSRAAHLLMLIFVLHGAPALPADVPSFSVTWRHVGVIEYIATHGSVDTGISAYFNWPGFFVLGALTGELAGLDSVLELTRWAPLVNNLLYLAPLIMIARSASDDPRLPWMAASIFYFTNWVYQDYFSPQGLTYLLYLSLFAIILTWLSGRRRPRRLRRRRTWRLRRWLQRRLRRRPVPASPRHEPVLRPSQQAMLMVICFVIVLAVVPSHQLTPFAILAGVSALALLGRGSFRGLPAIVLVLTVAWIMFAAGGYMNGHLDALKEDIGNLGSTVSSNVGSRVSGSDVHLAVTRLRLGIAVAVWALAALAAVRLWRRGGADRFVPHIALAAVPFGLVMMQAYGGEIMLRAYLFSIPFAAVLLASLVPARIDVASPLRVAAFSLATAALAASFLLTRYGNERIVLFTAGEVRAVERLTQTAPRGSLVLAPNPQLPWQAARVGEVRYRTLDSALAPGAGARPHDLAQAIEFVTTERRREPVFVVITRNNREFEHLFGGSTWGSIADLERSLAASPRFERTQSGPDAVVYALRWLSPGPAR